MAVLGLPCICVVDDNTVAAFGGFHLVTIGISLAQAIVNPIPQRLYNAFGTCNNVYLGGAVQHTKVGAVMIVIGLLPAVVVTGIG